MRQNGILGFSIPHLVPEIFRFLKYANEKRMSSFTHIDYYFFIVVTSMAEQLLTILFSRYSKIFLLFL